MSHMKWKETKQQSGTAGPGNILGCCLVSLSFLCDIHSIHRVTFDDGYDKIVDDKGEMTRVLKTQTEAKSYGPFNLDDEETEDPMKN